jgi:hypothetical protein
MIVDIVSKLRNHLAKPITDEPGVVYLLCEARKLLEKERPDPKPFALWMFCHWALHVDLSKSNTTLEFLRRVDNFVTNTVAGFAGNGPWSFLDEHRLFREFVYLDNFRNQLKELLSSYSLPTDLCDQDDRWFAFLSAYGGVIEDGTLSSETSKSESLTAVEKVTFRKGAQLSSQNHVSFTIQWDIVLKDGRVCRTEVDAKPALNMLFHLIHVIPARIATPVGS